MALSRSITIEWACSHYIFGTHDGIRIRITVTCAENMDKEIFAFRALPLDPTTGEKAAHFSHVCSPPDLVEWPKNAVDPMASPQWLRLPYVDVLVRSVAEADNFLALVKEDILRLKRSLDQMSQLQDPTEFTYGLGCREPDPEPGESESIDLPAVSWSSESAFMNAMDGGLVFATQGSWEIIADGPDTAPGTPDNYAVVTLLPGTSSHVLQISGFDLSDMNDAAVITGITITVSLRDATDGDESLGSIGADSLGAIDGPRLNAMRLMAAGYSSDNMAAGEEITGPDWILLQAGGDSDTWGLVGLTVGDLKKYGLALILSVYVPFTGRESTVEVDGASLALTTITRL